VSASGTGSTAGAGECPRCGAPGVPGARFCVRCGAATAPDGSAAPATATPAPPATAAPGRASRSATDGGPRPPVDARPRSPSDARPAGRGRTSWILLATLALVVLAGGVGAVAFVALRPGTPAATPAPAAADLLAPRSLDPDAPPFPVPTGATLENAIADGSGPGAYRIASWASPLDFAATVAFYADLRDSRWRPEGRPVALFTATAIELADERGVFDHAALQVDDTSPVRIAVRFVPAGPLPTGSPDVESASPIAFGTLPPATALPGGLPSWAVLPGASLVDGAESDTAAFAIYDIRGDVASARQSLLEAIESAGLSATVETPGNEVTLRVGGRDVIVLQPTADGVRVSVAVER